jgi:peptidoglycan/xylan/chitin deacetylase (PgdA/CDA1 family)
MMTAPAFLQMSLAAKSGGAALGLALLLAVPAPRLAILPLAAFVLVCLIAPFCPQCSFFLPVISRGRVGSRNIALTFDDGPSPHSTPFLLDLLAKYHLKATFFVVGSQAKAHPQLIRALLVDGHSIGNHSYFHDNLLMLKSARTLERDIRLTQHVLAQAGVRPLFFRPPVGITNSRLGAVLSGQGLHALTFSCRVYDRGNRNIGNLASRVLKKIRPGDILLLHDCPPGDKSTEYWLHELDLLFHVLKQRQLVVPLAELIGQPVMVSAKEKTAS